MKKFAVIVSYEPDVENLCCLCKKIISQGFSLVIVDNSESKRGLVKEISENLNCFIITNDNNMGIAYAQNKGVEFSESKGAEIIVFFDQDSVISDDLLYRLEESLMLIGECVMCPVSLEENTRIEYPSHRISCLGTMKNVYSHGLKNVVEVDVAISSGTAMYVNTFRKIGKYDEDFFIDFVDIEWCIRSRKKGIKIYIDPNAIMYHSIGQKSQKVGPMTIVKHSPARTYYKVRNSFLLLRKNINYLFAFRQIIPAVIHNLMLVFFVRNKREYLSFYLKGVFHGIIGKTGKFI